MSFQAMAWAVKQETGSPVSKLVLLMLANYADEHGKCYPSQEHLAKLCQCTRVSVNKHIKKLEADNFLKISKEKNWHYGYNTYVLNFGIVKNIYIANKDNLHNTQDKLINDKFNEFWDMCPRKIGKAKAKKIYQNLVAKKVVTEDNLISGIKKYKDSVINTETKFIAHPTTWLNQGRWEDELDIKGKNKNFLLG